MRPLISPEQLRAELAERELIVLDCRFSLAYPDEKELSYQNAHIPGAFYVHLERELSGPAVPGVTGRHPLPNVEEFARFCARVGIQETSSVVVYDDAGGAFAARLWWLLRATGHRDVRVLDGGLPAYIAAGGTLDDRLVQPVEGPLRNLAYDTSLVAALDDVISLSVERSGRLFDARASDRFRGENETIDRVPGHIPGARSLPFQENLLDGRFRSPESLRARFAEAFAGVPSTEVVFYCGSGVTACHNLLAAEIAGIGGVRLFPGSYSEWIADGTRGVET